MIALNEPWNGNLNGVRGIDLACYKQAREFGFTTTFRAFLSSRVQDLNKIVHFSDRHQSPIVNLRGEFISSSFDTLFNNNAHSHVLIYSFNGENITYGNAW